MGVCIYYRFCCTLLYVHSDGEERTGCFAEFFFLVSRDCYVAIPHGAMGLSAVVIVVFPDHTHLLFYIYIYIITLRCHILIKRVLHS